MGFSASEVSVSIALTHFSVTLNSVASNRGTATRDPGSGVIYSPPVTCRGDAQGESVRGVRNKAKSRHRACKLFSEVAREPLCF